jgi:hypothetical protein
MSEQLVVWIMGICVILFATAMTAQAVAGFRILLIIKPFLHQTRQLTNEAKRLVEMTGTMIHEATPRLFTTRDKVRDLAKTTAGRASGWKRGVEEIAELLPRPGGSSRAKPKGIREPAGPTSGQPKHKIEEES